MKLILAEPRLIKDSVGAISDLVNEVVFKIDKDKIELVAMDPANVAMVIFKLLGSAFVEYDVKQDVSIALSLDSLNSVLKRAKPTDTLIMELEEKKNRLRIQLKGESTRTFDLSLLDLDDFSQKVPNLKFKTTIEVPSAVFNDAIEDMDVVAESVTFVTEKDKFIIEAEGRLNSASVEITSDDGTVINNKEDRVIAKYSIEYLKKIMKGSKLSNNVVLQYGTDHPLQVDYKVMDKLVLSFILAPRMSN